MDNEDYLELLEEAWSQRGSKLVRALVRNRDIKFFWVYDSVGIMKELEQGWRDDD